MTRNCIKKENRLRKREILDICFCFIISFVIASSLAVFFRIMVIEGQSMEPVLYDSDIVLVSAVSLIDNSFESGDLAAYRCRVAYAGGSNYLVSRIIGVPGDEVEISEGVVYINGVPLENDYINEEKIDFNMDKSRVKKDQVFVLSDNIGQSYEGNYYELNFISYEDIIGKVWLRLFPLERVGTLK